MRDTKGKNTNYLIGIITMNTFTQINELAIQCQDIVVEYNKDAVKYGIDKVEMKSTEYYEMVITHMLSAGATINDIKVNHVQIALGKFPEDENQKEVDLMEANKGNDFSFDSVDGTVLFYTCGNVLAKLTCKYGQWGGIGKLNKTEKLLDLIDKGVFVELSIISQ